MKSARPRIVGLSLDEVRTQYGSPAEERDVPPAHVLRYRDGNCTVDIDFYLDVTRNAFYALNYAARVGDKTADPQDNCLKRIGDANRKK